jgi:hypothetical protein
VKWYRASKVGGVGLGSIVGMVKVDFWHALDVMNGPPGMQRSRVESLKFRRLRA